jgi:hypothetical protein
MLTYAGASPRWLRRAPRCPHPHVQDNDVVNSGGVLVCCSSCNSCNKRLAHRRRLLQPLQHEARSYRRGLLQQLQHQLQQEDARSQYALIVHPQLLTLLLWLSILSNQNTLWTPIRLLSLVFCDVSRLRGVKQGGGVTLKTQRQQFSNAMKVLCKYDFNILALHCYLPSDATSLAHLAPSHHTHTHTACSQRLLFAYSSERCTLRQTAPTHPHPPTPTQATLHALLHTRHSIIWATKARSAYSRMLTYADVC